jgi:hypothetical protein
MLGSGLIACPDCGGVAREPYLVVADSVVPSTSHFDLDVITGPIGRVYARRNVSRESLLFVTI